MKALVFAEAGNVELQEVPKPSIKAGEVMVKVEACGICGSDIHALKSGVVYSVGVIMGHEFSGVIEEVGDGAGDWKAGDRVCVKPWAECGTCSYCRQGWYSLCPTALSRCIGVAPEFGGAFSEYVKVAYPHEVLYRLPDTVTFEQGALVEPLATSLHAIMRSSFRPGDTTIVLGGGMIGMGVVQLLKLSGAGEIILVELSETKGGIARQLGADHVLNPIEEGEGIADRVMELTNGQGADIVFECVGVPATFSQTVPFCRSGGEVMVVGLQDADVTFSALNLLLKEVDMKGVLGYYDEFDPVIKFLEKGMIRSDLLITEIIKLPDIIEKGFNKLMDPSDNIKILVKPQ